MRDSLPQPTAASRRRRAALILGGTVLALSVTCLLQAGEYVSGIPWREPKVVNPGPVGGPPSDALVLFDGHDLSQWVDGKDWPVKDGYALSAKHDLHTKQAFGDCQLHVEWATPEKVEGHGQERGNSGVYMMARTKSRSSIPMTTDLPRRPGRLHLQAMAAAGECLPQARRVAELRHHFRGPRFDKKGKLHRPAFVTILQNGVLVQNHTRILGTTLL